MKLPKWPDPSSSNFIDLGLDRVLNALEKLDNPHLKLPPVIHVAGTNGKGSTIAFLRAMLEAAGKKCHVYTSPHLVEFNERIVVAGEQISDDMLNEVIDETKNKCEEIKLTFFEGTTLASFLAFSKVPADYVLLETGMGGRLDATNVIPNPALTIITPISFDHTEFLGDTIEKIAYEKACIIKKDSKCIVAEQPAEALKVINDYAKEVGSNIINYGQDFFAEINKDGSFVYRDERSGMGLPKPSLRGKHQCMNAAVAARAATELGIDKQAIKTGIRSAQWGARIEKLVDNVYLDGGHNAQAAETIRDFILEENAKNKKHNIAIVGMMKTKDFGSFIRNIKPAFNEIFAIPVPGENYRDPAEMKKLCDILNIKCTAFDNFEDAYAKACNGASAINNRTVICGSLYLAGYVLEHRTAQL
jgi:dihydrofolate synthase/folylpolyglutamate synthase